MIPVPGPYSTTVSAFLRSRPSSIVLARCSELGATAPITLGFARNSLKKSTGDFNEKPWLGSTGTALGALYGLPDLDHDLAEIRAWHFLRAGSEHDLSRKLYQAWRRGFDNLSKR